MFTVGEFSTLAQVSKRLLRYYDEIGLLKPAHTDHLTGYRYYSAEQMAELNRILVLKELGLTLDQIHRMLQDQISTDEMQGMLLLKKAEIEQQLRAELQRMRKIEARLQAIQRTETHKPMDVVIKQIPAQAIVSVQTIVESFEAALVLHAQIRYALPQRSGYGLSFTICHDEDIVERDMNLEIGRIVDTNLHLPVVQHENLHLSLSELPAVEMMATTVVSGSMEVIHAGYGGVGLWAQANGYRLAGTPREMMLQAAQSPDGHDLVTEIQFPVEPMR
jgi:DNA-binding transcriptional MerR regulator